MDTDSTSQFVSFLAKSIQAFCSEHLQYSSCVEVIGHIHLNIDHSVKLDYVLSEEVNKTAIDSGAVFSSHSYLSHPPANVSSPSGVDAGSHSGSHHDYCQDPPLANSDLICPSRTSSAQDTPSDENHSFAVSLDPGLGETSMSSNLMKVSVSFDYNALPIVKQESNQEMESHIPEIGRVQENCQSAHNMNSQQAVTLSHENVQPEVCYQQENIQPVVCSRQENTHPAVSYRQENVQQAVFRSQDSSQPLVSTMADTNESTVVHLQETHQCAVTHIQQNGQPALPVVSLQENYQIVEQENHNQHISHTVTCTQETGQPVVRYLQASHLPSDNEDSECGVGRDQQHRVVSSSGDFQPAVADHRCGMDMGSNIQFESLCLDVTAVKQEVLSDIPDNQSSSGPLNSGQEMESTDFGGVVIERLGHQIEGTQLIVVREGMQQEQQLPFPIMLHAHSDLSAPISVSPDIETPVSVLPLSASTPSQSSSSTDLHLISDGAHKRYSKKKQGSHAGFQPGNKCWQLQARWKKAKGNRRKLHQGTSADKTISSRDEVKVNKKGPSRGLTSPRTVPSKATKTVKKGKSLPGSKTVKKVSSSKAQAPNKKGRSPNASIVSQSSKPKGPIHTLKKVPWTGQQKKQPRKCCRVCKEKGLFPMSCYFCPRCPRQPGYCRIRNCFSSYHSKMGLRYCVSSASGKTS